MLRSLCVRHGTDINSAHFPLKVFDSFPYSPEEKLGARKCNCSSLESYNPTDKTTLHMHI